MKKVFILFLTTGFPILVFAQNTGGSLSFAPPPGDYSVVFLGNVFGQVDGVLYGSGSLLLGVIFGVFNSAVMALGGIIIMYTLLVSTMNTAQEGQLLGQKWSSIWIPIRSTIGLALLVPKASGYCMMQIFIMWVVVQGVGAADKIWDAALNYLQRGGSIIQANMDPQVSLEAGGGSVSDGATNMLAGQVCMNALQTILQNQRNTYMENKENGAGPCANAPTGDMKEFCDTPVPDFINSFNAVENQNKPLAELLQTTSFSQQMPNLKSEPYSKLNGICGTITWNNFITSELKNISSDAAESKTWEDLEKALSKVSNPIGISNLQTIAMSRAIAVQQMYQSLSPLARRIVNNMPGLQGGDSTNNTTPVSSVAIQPFGLPLTSGGQVCTKETAECVNWGTPFGSGSAPLLNGKEFQDAITNYNAIMKPALTLFEQMSMDKAQQDAKKFINDAKTKGWIMAGSYFFSLVQLNVNAMVGNELTDEKSGLNNSTFDPSNVKTPFADNNKCQSPYEVLCTWMGGVESQINQVETIINGSGILTKAISKPSVNKDLPKIDSTDEEQVSNALVGSSTVYGFIINAERLKLPGQPGQAGPTFAVPFNFTFDVGPLYLKKQDFGCFGKIMGICLGSDIVGGTYNYIIRNILNAFLTFFTQMIQMVVQALLILPIMGMARIFQYGVSYITAENVDPIVALANMGVYYINFASELWIVTISVSVITALIPVVGQAIFALLMLVMPFLMAWMAIMLAVGFITAYYIPFVPYMIFTFGSIAWLMAVIEAMVAAPIVALGITHPEGNEAFGKGEQAIMLILNVFLRPAMMVIGFFTAIMLSYVTVWILNAGFQNVSSFMLGTGGGDLINVSGSTSAGLQAGKSGGDVMTAAANEISPNGYKGWAGIYAFFFSVLMYTSLYVIVVQKSFTLITLLPDKVLRWIGGQPESIGAETAQWGEEAKQRVEKAGGETAKASAQMDQQLSTKAFGGMKKIKGGSGQSGVNIAQGSTPSNSDEG